MLTSTTGYILCICSTGFDKIAIQNGYEKTTKLVLKYNSLCATVNKLDFFF